MAQRRSRRVALSIGSRVEVCVDNRHDLLRDMAIQGPDGSLLNGVYMYGRVTGITPNYYSVELPAAEDTLKFPKEKCVALSEAHKVPKMYVLFGNQIQTVVGLRLSGSMRPKDYFDKLSEAKEEVDKLSQKVSLQGSSKSGASTTPAAEVSLEPVNSDSQLTHNTTTSTKKPTTTPTHTSIETPHNASTLVTHNTTATPNEKAVSPANINSQTISTTPIPTETPSTTPAHTHTKTPQNPPPTSVASITATAVSTPPCLPALRRSIRVAATTNTPSTTPTTTNTTTNDHRFSKCVILCHTIVGAYL